MSILNFLAFERSSRREMPGVLSITMPELAMMPDAEMQLPYDGAKQMMLVDEIDNREVLCRLVHAVWEDLPKRK